MKPATSNLARHWGFPRPIIISHQKKKWLWPWARVAPHYLGSTFNSSVTAGANDFKFDAQLAAPNAHHKNHK